MTDTPRLTEEQMEEAIRLADQPIPLVYFRGVVERADLFRRALLQSRQDEEEVKQETQRIALQRNRYMDERDDAEANANALADERAILEAKLAESERARERKEKALQAAMARNARLRALLSPPKKEQG